MKNYKRLLTKSKYCPLNKLDYAQLLEDLCFNSVSCYLTFKHAFYFDWINDRQYENN